MRSTSTENPTLRYNRGAVNADRYDTMAVLDQFEDPGNRSVRFAILHEEDLRSHRRFITITREHLRDGQWTTATLFRVMEHLIPTLTESLTHIAAWCEPAE